MEMIKDIFFKIFPKDKIVAEVMLGIIALAAAGAAVNKQDVVKRICDAPMSVEVKK